MTDDNRDQHGNDAPPGGPSDFPEPPDITRVHELRKQLNSDRRARDAADRSRRSVRLGEKAGRQIRQVGIYTVIPSLMLAGPAVGYGLGWLVERQFGGKPWASVCGILLGVAAAFQQIILILKRNSKPKD